MTDLEFEIKRDIDVEEPVLIEGLPGIGYVGKLAADHLVEKLEAEKFAAMTSHHFPHHVNVNPDGTLELLKANFYHKEVNGQDLVILAGDVQATSSEGHYDVTHRLLNIADDLGVKRIFALGGYATGKHSSSKPKVIGASNEEKILEKYRDQGIDVEEGSGPVLGVTGLLLGLGKDRDMEGSALLGETHGMLVDHRSAQSVLEALTNILGFEVDMSKLEERAKKTEKILSRLQKEQKLREVKEAGEDDELSYIG